MPRPKPAARVRFFVVRLTPDSRKRLQRAAKSARTNAHHWARTRLLAAIRSQLSKHKSAA